MEARLVLAPPSPRRLLFVWLLPAAWIALCLLGFRYHGDGYQLFLLGSMAGAWALLVAEPGTQGEAVLPVLLAGALVMLLFGWMLDRLRAELWLWLASCGLAWTVAGYLLLQGYQDLDAAVAHQGSLLAFGVCATQLGGYAATIVALGAGTFRRRPVPHYSY